jgi:hypothetical protein
MEDEKPVSVLRHLMGAEQWERFKKEQADEEGLISGDILNAFQAAFEGHL